MMHGEHGQKMEEGDMAAMGNKKMMKGQAGIPRVNIELSLEDFPELAGKEVGDEVMLHLIGKVDSVGKGLISAGFDSAKIMNGKMREMESGEKPHRLEEVFGEKKKMSAMGGKH